MPEKIEIPTILPVELEEIAGSYRYEADVFYGLERHVWSLIQNYAGDYGQSVIEHLSRVSSTLHEFLPHAGFDPGAARNVAHAFRLHDAGKTMQPPSLWNLPGKPDAETKKQRSAHVFLGRTVLEETMPAFAHLAGHPHLSVIECLMRHHHERIDGRGPAGLKGNELGPVLEYAGIIDGMDGKMIPRTDGKPRTAPDVLREMSGISPYTAETKHAGEFAFGRLQDVAHYIQKGTGIAVFDPA